MQKKIWGIFGILLLTGCTSQIATAPGSGSGGGSSGFTFNVPAFDATASSANSRQYKFVRSLNTTVTASSLEVVTSVPATDSVTVTFSNVATGNYYFHVYKDNNSNGVPDSGDAYINASPSDNVNSNASLGVKIMFSTIP